MKLLVIFFLSFSIFTNAQYCENEISLFKSELNTEAVFDFNLNGSEIQKHLIASSCLDFCEDNRPLSALFLLSKEELKIDVYMEDFELCDTHQPLCNRNATGYYATKTNQIVINDEILSEDIESCQAVSNVLNSMSSHRKISLWPFIIGWHPNSTIEKRIFLLESLIDGSLNFANEIALKKYNITLCELDKFQLDEIKNDFQIFLSIINSGIQIPPPPPPEPIVLYYE